MKYLKGQFYVEVKDHRYKFHPTEKIILRKPDPPKSLRTQNQVQNETLIRKNQKVIKNDNDQLVANYPRNKHKTQQQQKIKPPNCPNCKQNEGLEFNKGWYCTNCEYNINKQKLQINKNVRRENHYISIRLPYANEKVRKIWMNIVITTYNSTDDMINNLQSLKGKTKLKFYKKISNYYGEMKHKNFQTQEDRFIKNARGISEIYHEVLLLMKFLQTNPQVENMIINFYDL